jgi:hypothetical protein
MDFFLRPSSHIGRSCATAPLRANKTGRANRSECPDVEQVLHCWIRKTVRTARAGNDAVAEVRHGIAPRMRLVSSISVVEQCSTAALSLEALDRCTQAQIHAKPRFQIPCALHEDSVVIHLLILEQQEH